MYLNIILTILTLILLGIFISAIYFWKKYLKKFLWNSKSISNKNITDFKNQPTLEDSFKFINEMMKNLPKR